MTQRERSVLAAMSKAAEPHLAEPDVHQLLVVGECNCGCPTIYFNTEKVRNRPAAEAYTTIERGEEVTLFASEDALWALDWNGSPDPPPNEFPDPSDLTVWKPPR
jgi:hypothetical protein